MRRLALVLAVAALAGCGGGESGKATLWVTRDRGNDVILRQQVPAGLTAMQALDRAADIDTRYGGRFVQSVNGISGSLAQRRDWFYFINGYEGDRSASEYKLRPGDVEWWDFRSWKGEMSQPLVVGAFPEPFLHGFGGKTRPARVVYLEPDQRAAAEKLATLLHGRAIGTLPQAPGAPFNVLVLEPQQAGSAPLFTAGGKRGAGPGSPVFFRYRGDPELLLRTPPFGRLKYEVPS